LDFQEKMDYSLASVKRLFWATEPASGHLGEAFQFATLVPTRLRSRKLAAIKRLDGEEIERTG
jgi:hypothetical protein